MTNTQFSDTGLPAISRPNSTWIERASFYIQRNWKWTTVIGCIAGTALAVGGFSAAAFLQGEELTDVKVLSVILMLLPLNYIPVFVVPLIEQKVAPPWMIRAALASATDDERAFLFERLQQVAVSEWRNGPLDRGELFTLFRQARYGFGDHIKRKRERMVEMRDRQVEEISAIRDASTGSS